METWKSCQSFPGYSANNQGKIRNDVTKRVLNQTSTNGRGYYATKIKWPNKEKMVTTDIHILVADAWLGVRPEGLDIDHINRTKTDNRPENLRYATRSENRLNSNNENFYHNIWLDKEHGKWHVICQRKEGDYKAVFNTALEAIEARDKFIKDGVKTQKTNILNQKNIKQEKNGRFRVCFQGKKDGVQYTKFAVMCDTLQEAITARDDFLAKASSSSSSAEASSDEYLKQSPQ